MFNLPLWRPSLPTANSQQPTTSKYLTSIVSTAAMASEALPQPELTAPSVKPQEVSFTLPKAFHTTAHVHLNFLGHCAMVFLATSSPAESGGSIKPMGSFVYAMPDVSIHPFNVLFCQLSTEYLASLSPGQDRICIRLYLKRCWNSSANERPSSRCACIPVQGIHTHRSDKDSSIHLLMQTDWI